MVPSSREWNTCFFLQWQTVHSKMMHVFVVFFLLREKLHDFEVNLFVDPFLLHLSINIVPKMTCGSESSTFFQRGSSMQAKGNMELTTLAKGCPLAHALHPIRSLSACLEISMQLLTLKRADASLRCFLINVARILPPHVPVQYSPATSLYVNNNCLK